MWFLWTKFLCEMCTEIRIQSSTTFVFNLFDNYRSRKYGLTIASDCYSTSSSLSGAFKNSFDESIEIGFGKTRFNSVYSIEKKTSSTWSNRCGRSNWTSQWWFSLFSKKNLFNWLDFIYFHSESCDFEWIIFVGIDRWINYSTIERSSSTEFCFH